MVYPPQGAGGGGLTWAEIKNKLETEGSLNKQYDADIDGIIDTGNIPWGSVNSDLVPVTDAYMLGSYSIPWNRALIKYGIDFPSGNVNAQITNLWEIRVTDGDNTLRIATAAGLGLWTFNFGVSPYRVQSACEIVPTSDNYYNIGSSGLRWKEIYGVNGYFTQVNADSLYGVLYSQGGVYLWDGSAYQNIDADGDGIIDDARLPDTVKTGPYTEPTRSLGTVYQNTTGKYLLVIVNIWFKATGGGIGYFDLGTSTSVTPRQKITCDSIGDTFILVGVVPPNYYYRARGAPDPTDYSLQWWIEVEL